jgi:DUF971 family protein
MTANDWPDEIRLTDGGRTLALRYDGGKEFDLPAEYLRVESPSAEVKGHAPGQETLVSGKRNVRIKTLDPVGAYAVRILFDDGHSTGLYTWDYLVKLGREHAILWQAYLEKLSASGSSRD